MILENEELLAFNKKYDTSNFKLIYEIIDQYALITPDKIAIKCDDESITYRELYEKSNQLSWLLREKGVARDTLVGILCERSILIVIGILAIWKAGGAYIPLDTNYPEERIKTILNDSKTPILLTLKELLSESGQCYNSFISNTCLEHIIYIDGNEIKSYPPQKPHYVNEIFDLCYVIYTSGSTGTPKGVLIEHIGMTNHMYAMKSELSLDNKSIIVQNASQCFDISVWQFFNALIVGGQTCIYTDKLVFNPNKFIKRIIKDEVTILQVVPSYLDILLNTLDLNSMIIKSLCYLLVTGEKVSPFLINRWFQKFPEIKVVNAYGPAEAADDVTLHVMDKMPNEILVPIGKPIQNINVYVVDENMNVCSIGVKGEICVSGIGVGRGYLNDKITSDKAFIIDPFVKNDKLRMYKTGDFGRWLLGGVLEYLGRNDSLVKIRGYRIELDEIENVMAQINFIKDIAVITKDYLTNDKCICAYFTADTILDNSNIRNYLSNILPHYMIPKYFIQLNKMPLNSNGKVDRKALLEYKNKSEE